MDNINDNVHDDLVLSYSQNATLETLWKQIVNQGEDIQRALAVRLISILKTPKTMKRNLSISEAHRIDDALYGSIELPSDFDYEKELASAINDKYGL